MSRASSSTGPVASSSTSSHSAQVSTEDTAWKYDADAYKQYLEDMPWRKNERYFSHVKISALALLKMVMHAVGGGNLEVMGILQGKAVENTFYVMDTFALPVEGTETRVNAGNEANAYLSQYMTLSEKLGRTQPSVGWYHSHPGYGCWMSGIDVATQKLGQYMDPYLAIVVDPVRTISSGKIEVGSFRTWPEGYKPTAAQLEDQGVPEEKFVDWGKQADQYYKLDTTFIQSQTDKKLVSALQQRFWVSTLSTTAFISHNDYYTRQIRELVAKLAATSKEKGKGSSAMGHLQKRMQTVLREQASALTTHIFKHSLFGPH